MTSFSFLCPAKTCAGKHALEHLPFELSAMGAQKPMVIQDRISQDAGLPRILTRAFAASGMTLGISAPVPGPEAADDLAVFLRSAYDTFRENGYDALIALGTSRAAHTAKALNIAVSQGPEALRKNAVTQALAPLVFLPATTDAMAGAAPKTEFNGQVFDSPFLSPSLVLMDPSLMVPDTRNDLLDRSLICLALGCEVFSRAPAPPARAYAATAVSLAWSVLNRFLDAGLKGPDNLRTAARENLACQQPLIQAAVMAGYLMAGPEPRYTLMIGEALAVRGRASQGQIMALALPAVLESCPGPELGPLLRHLTDAETFSAVPGPQQPVSSVQTLRQLIHRIFSLSHGLLPRTLEEAGWTAPALENLSTELAETRGLDKTQTQTLNLILTLALDGRPK